MNHIAYCNLLSQNSALCERKLSFLSQIGGLNVIQPWCVTLSFSRFVSKEQCSQISLNSLY